MPIHDAGYRVYAGQRTTVAARWLAILRTEFGLAFRTKALLGLYLLCIAPFVLQFAQVFLRYVQLQNQAPGGGQMPSGLRRLLDPSLPKFYLDPVFQPLSVLAFVIYSTAIGAAAIARDKRSNAMELYFSRAIGGADYLLGKWGAVFALLCMQNLVTTVFVWTSAVLLAPDWGTLETTLPFVPRLLLALVLVDAFLAWLIVGLSAATDSPTFAALLWVLVFVFLRILADRLRSHLVQPSWSILSPWDSARRVTEWIVDVAPAFDFPAWHAIAAVMLFAAAAALLLRRGLRAVEVA